MSLYGPKLRLPKINIPDPSNPSWGLEKERKIVGVALIVIIFLLIIVYFGPIFLEQVNELISFELNPAVRVVWMNNPLDITKNVKEAQLNLILTNNTKELINETTFSVSTDSEEIIVFCPPSLYDATKSTYLIKNLSPQDEREIPCIVRRNSSASVFTGVYTINVNTSLGNTSTKFRIITK